MVVVSPSFSVPVEGIIYQSPSVQLIVNNDVDLGAATLYITEHNVVWGGGEGRQGGPAPTVMLMYRNISLHAIQRDPGPGLIMIVNHEISLPEMTQQGAGDAAADDDDDEYDADEEPVTKLRFIPANENDLEAMYLAMNQGQSMHPDPADEIEDDDEHYMDGEEFDEGEDEFEDAEESNMSAEDAAARFRAMRLEDLNGQPERKNGEVEDGDIGE